MTRTAINYGTALYQLRPSQEAVETMEALFQACPQLAEALDNPTVTRASKHRVVERLFPRELWNFGKVVSDHRRARELTDMTEAYRDCLRREQKVLPAELLCVTEPSEEQKEGFRQLLQREYQVQKVELTVRKAPELIGGFLLRAGGREYDWSLRGRMRQMEQTLVRR